MKSKLTLFILLTTITTLFMACGQSKNTGEQADMHTSEIALDWQGVYYGVLPCADCEGIEVELRITEDGTYTMKSQYLGKENGLFITEGTFTWENGSNIQLEDAQDNSTKLYKVEENQLRMLDAEGHKIEGALENFCVLKKGGITTLMACPDDTEDQLIKVLNTVDNISVGEGTLTLNKARMAPMAVLKEVKE